MTLSDEKIKDVEEALGRYSSPAKVLEHPVWLTNCLYGNFKVGKTVAAAHIPKTLIFACDRNWTSILDYPELHDVEVQQFQGLRHWETFIVALKEDLPIYREFKHIMIDPFNALVDTKIDWLQDNFTPSKQGDNRTVWTPKPGRIDEKAQTFTSPGMSDYQVVRDYFRKYVNPLSFVQKHITYVCHVREPGFTDKVKIIRPALPGKTWEMIARQCSFISYMEDINGKRTISFETDQLHDGGSVFKALHGKVINADKLHELYSKYEMERNFDNVRY